MREMRDIDAGFVDGAMMVDSGGFSWLCWFGEVRYWM